ncbi:hypothetical protein BU24DRAFT_115806 [Aaosphaeria arxii CBS 175.79]|uniref:Uncharacterized protein n=1 Tax=Aaosphaeria arxii CBS 175.79 TaxID=1450172 RepID=A0A6A5Y387_9PLEO|nr:uncharacterized protein BU24DRAFT_115806 [Aaosphaeria arxii CBS 175.79]KAF2019270.1 hypothetical protein BU24DRAFT_115806 [Aaosphaeria arxii CBS 175.79]
MITAPTISSHTYQLTHTHTHTFSLHAHTISLSHTHSLSPPSYSTLFRPPPPACTNSVPASLRWPFPCAQSYSLVQASAFPMPWSMAHISIEPRRMLAL